MTPPTALATPRRPPQLPNELWLQIIAYVPIGEHIALRAVDKHMRALSKAPALWRRVIDQALAHPSHVDARTQSHAYGALRQARRTLEVLPPPCGIDVHKASPKARAAALRYACAGFASASPGHQAALDGFIRSIAPYLAQDDLRLLWRTIFGHILQTIKLTVPQDAGTSAPSPLLARAVIRESQSGEAVLWFDVVRLCLAQVQAPHRPLAHHMAADALDHVMGQAPASLMPALLQAALALRLQEPAYAAFQMPYIGRCVARLTAANCGALLARTQALLAADTPPHVQAAIELGLATWRRAHDDGDDSAQAAFDLLWRVLAHPDCEGARVRGLVLPAVCQHAPADQLLRVWHLALCGPASLTTHPEAQREIYDVLVHRCPPALLDEVWKRVFTLVATDDIVVKRRALQAATALCQHPATQTKRPLLFAALHAQCERITQTGVQSSPQDRCTLTQADRENAADLIETLVIVACAPDADVAYSEALFSMVWQCLETNRLRFDVCVAAMQTLAPHVCGALHFATFIAIQHLLLHPPANTLPHRIIAYLRSLDCVAGYLSGIHHAQALSMVFDVMARFDVQCGAVAADVLTRMARCATDRKRAVQCIRVRAALTLQNYHLGISELAALDALKRCELALSRPAAQMHDPVMSERLHVCTRTSQAVSPRALWRTAHDSCESLLDALQRDARTS